MAEDSQQEEREGAVHIMSTVRKKADECRHSVSLLLFIQSKIKVGLSHLC